jgi:hypothetical protein
MHPSVPTDVAGCVDLLVERGAAFRVQDAVDAVANGNVRFHPEYADACVAAVNASSCAQWGPSFGIYGGTSPWEPCQNMVEGLVADGQACSNRFECVSGDCVSSICIARGSLGDSCGTEPYYLCKSGLGCMGTPPTCQPQHASGEACTLASDCLARECDIPTQTCVWDCEMP